MAVVSFRKELPPSFAFSERLLPLQLQWWKDAALGMRLLLRPATTAKAVATSLSQIGGKAKGSFQGFRVKDLPHAFDSLSSKPFIARQSKRSLPAAAAAAPRRRLHSRSTVDRSTMLLLYYTSSNTQWRLFNKKDDKIIWFCVCRTIE